MDRSEQQRTFHASADGQRFTNRLSNPFIRSRELRLLQRIADRLPRGTGRLLEVGCGEGSNLVMLHPLLPKAALTGVDASVEKIHFLQAHVPRAEAVCADAQALPFPDATFDLVFCRDLLHHVNWARRKVLAEALRVVKPGGTVAIVEASGRTALNRLFQKLYPAERGLADSTPESLTALGREFGQPTLEFVEASMLLRAVGFLLGWPTGPARWLAWAAYQLAAGWDALAQRLLPKRRWPYMLLTLQRQAEPTRSTEVKRPILAEGG